ncbi:hypothetical protein LWI29_008699 [Acer saccharum]|uniref:Uncharacterized protein n=1 Tax=Acer saccharum TaxID=4024 RepID=A0AA39RC74_ACESA|nr:hypothetical protein LWI29_008699 [Acer saccharum]
MGQGCVNVSADEWAVRLCRSVPPYKNICSESDFVNRCFDSLKDLLDVTIEYKKVVERNEARSHSRSTVVESHVAELERDVYRLKNLDRLRRQEGYSIAITLVLVFLQNVCVGHNHLPFATSHYTRDMESKLSDDENELGRWDRVVSQVSRSFEAIKLLLDKFIALNEVKKKNASRKIAGRISLEARVDQLETDVEALKRIDKPRKAVSLHDRFNQRR